MDITRSTTQDRIDNVEIALYQVPMPQAVSDAKVLTGKQQPLQSVEVLVVELHTVGGEHGIGFSYSLRAGSQALYAHALELAPALLGEYSHAIPRLWEKLAWLGGSVSRTGVSVQAIAAFDIALWDMKAKRARLSLANLLGAYRQKIPCYNTSGGYLSASIEDVVENAQRSLANGMGGIKLKVGQPDAKKDIERVRHIRELVGNQTPLMVDANQQWDHAQALRVGQALESLDLTWIEEPLSAYDYAGHASLTQRLSTPIATGEMLSSQAEHDQLMDHRAVTYLQPDAPRVGGITPFLKIASRAERLGLKMAPHFVMEIHVHLAAAYPHETWVEHIEWLEPLFNERLVIASGHMHVPQTHGLGWSLSEQAVQWRTAHQQFRS
ncbi:L-talarate/galactarate dehydratase [Halomonas dongshanensis]|uniref:Mandelate racemase/muconate lactonizing enzyme family protein n=1 Tax=Halomonas dongshanensis TaxID=2890835 RepID=A0ABT2EAJ8_9GAMM|nr:mandelate racemase/muconate lactonizing enzyme family protein [Halomonas dongshanensis]MCS2608603.1 mandelate racemase/muconate lactonizing enzyme family protein [Halomonas dongshanensis]